MKILIVGAPGQQMGLSALLAHRPDIQVVTEVPEPKRDPFAEVIEIHAPEPLWQPPPLNNKAPYYEHYRQRANRRKR